MAAGKNPWDELIAGIVAGGTVTLCLHPLDLLKTRLQVATKQRNSCVIPSNSPASMIGQFKQILEVDGVKGLYRGLLPNFLGAVTAWGTYFLLYSYFKQIAQRRKEGSSPRLTSLEYFVAAGAASFSTVTITNPIWLLKVRMCTQDLNNPQYRNTAHAIQQIYARHGLRGFYAGLLSGLAGSSHGAIQFMVYERLKHVWTSHKADSSITEFSSLDYVLMSSIAKTCASLVAYPLHVVRARLQRHQTSMLGMIRDMARREGLRGFYGGMLPGTIRVMPGTWITFVVYEKISALLSLSRSSAEE